MKSDDHINIEQFDTETYLQEKGIEYNQEGKNTTTGWIEVACPFCGDDPSYHLGISSERLINCWRCGEKGNIIKYIKEVEECSWGKAKSIAKKYLDPTINLHPIEKDILYSTKTVMPKLMKPLTEKHYEYLESRGFDPLKIERKYRLQAVDRILSGEDKKFQFRIIIPVFIGKTIVNFTARDYTGKQSPKYLNQSNDKVVIPIKDCLYNLNSVRDIALIVEGATDVWRMGDGVVGTLGIEFTTHQVNLLIKKNPKKCYLLFDQDDRAQEQAERLADILSGFFPTYVLYLDSGDPGSLPQDDADAICRDIGLL